MSNQYYTRPRNDDEVKVLAAIFDAWRETLSPNEQATADWYVFQLTSLKHVGEPSAKAELCKILTHNKVRRHIRSLR